MNQSQKEGERMSSPQLEDGFTRIANEILEIMAKTKLSPTQYKILFVVWRFTYGFQRKSHKLSLSFIANATSSNLRHVQREIKKMVDQKILIITNDLGQTRSLSFNKNFKEWVTTIGEIDNGKIVNGKIANCLNSHQTIGEIDNRTIGEIDKEERNKERFKEKIAATTNDTEEHFENLWKLYPKKIGKNSITKKTKAHLLESVTVEAMNKAIKKYAEETKDFERKFILNGSTWFNGRYIDYLEEEKNISAPPKPQKIPTYGSYDDKIAELQAAELSRTKR